MIMDELNRKIIGLLTKNARITNTEIAKGLGLSESAVRYRIKNLEKNTFVAILQSCAMIIKSDAW